MQADDLIVVRQLRAGRAPGSEDTDELDDELSQVTGLSAQDDSSNIYFTTIIANYFFTRNHCFPLTMNAC